MRKFLVVSLLIFAIAFAVGVTSTDQAQAAKQDPCWYQCDCNGVALYCCKYRAIVNCKIILNAPIECTQQAGC